MSVIWSPRIDLRTLAGLCRRLGTGLIAGVDVRKMLAREAQSAHGPFLSRHLSSISEAVNDGTSLSAAVNATGDYFPELFRELIAVGEQTGHLGEMFKQLADSYDYQIQLRRQFRSSLFYPAFQLSMAILSVGALIWASGMVSQKSGAKVDLLNIGLVGESGLRTYLISVALVAVGLFVGWRLLNRGTIWVRPIQRAVLKVPKLGKALKTLAIARFAWALQLTLDSGMDVRRSLNLAFRSTNNDYYRRHADDAWATVRGGGTLHEALDATGAFPFEFVAAVEVGEQSGRLPETLAVLNKQYQEEGRSASAVLVWFLGFAVSALVAVLLIWLIFRFWGSYVPNIQKIIDGK